MRLEVQGGVVDFDSFVQQSILPLQPGPEIRSLECGQQPDQRHRNPGFLNEIDLGIERVVIVVIEPENEAAQNLHALPLDLAHSLEQVVVIAHVDVLRFLHLLESLRVGRLYSEEDGVETGLDHDIHQVVHSDEIDARFREQGKGVVALLLPFGDRREEP